MSELPMMPKATAVWLIENTVLTFEQISEFCGLHPLEVQAIADGDVAAGMAGHDPIANDQLTADEIKRCEGDTKGRLKLSVSDMPLPAKRAKGARYTSVSKRQDKPDGIAWLLRTFPELTDAQIGKLLGTTKPTISAIRDRTHWNAANIRPRDPVDLGLCNRAELDEAVQRSRRREARRAKDAAREARKAGIEPPEAPIPTGGAVPVAATEGAGAGAADDMVMGTSHAEPLQEGELPTPTAPPAEAEPTADAVFKSVPKDESEEAPAAEGGPDNPVLDPNLLFKPKPAEEGEAAETAEAAEPDEKDGG